MPKEELNSSRPCTGHLACLCPNQEADVRPTMQIRDWCHLGACSMLISSDLEGYEPVISPSLRSGGVGFVTFRRLLTSVFVNSALSQG